MLFGPVTSASTAKNHMEVMLILDFSSSRQDTAPYCSQCCCLRAIIQLIELSQPQVIGVAQVINKKGGRGVFTDKDEEVN